MRRALAGSMRNGFSFIFDMEQTNPTIHDPSVGIGHNRGRGLASLKYTFIGARSAPIIGLYVFVYNLDSEKCLIIVNMQYFYRKMGDTSFGQSPLKEHSTPPVTIYSFQGRCPNFVGGISVRNT